MGAAAESNRRIAPNTSADDLREAVREKQRATRDHRKASASASKRYRRVEQIACENAARQARELAATGTEDARPDLPLKPLLTGFEQASKDVQARSGGRTGKATPGGKSDSASMTREVISKITFPLGMPKLDRDRPSKARKSAFDVLRDLTPGLRHNEPDDLDVSLDDLDCDDVPDLEYLDDGDDEYSLDDSLDDDDGFGALDDAESSDCNDHEDAATDGCDDGDTSSPETEGEHAAG